VTIPRSVILLDWGATLALLLIARTVPRLLHNNLRSWLYAPPGTKALIAGANDAGEALLRTIRHAPELNYRPVGFVDDQPHTRGRRIAGVPVLGGFENLAELAEQHGVAEVLLTADALPGKQVRQILEMAETHDFCVKVLPSYQQLLQERVDISPRSVAIADLLRRPSVELDKVRIQKWITGRTVLVTGSSGSIGSEICRQILDQAPAKIVVVDRSETGQFFLERELRRLAPATQIEVALADLTDGDRMRAVFAEHQPDIIFHAAAYKHVPLMEAHVGEAVKNIVLATRNLVDLAETFEVEALVMISTDKAVNPTSVMGSCKRLAEQYVQAKAATSPCRLVTVRFGNVLDSAGSVVPIFREQIAQGGPVTVTHPDMVRYFMLIPEAAQLVIQAGTMGQGGEIFVLDMGDPVKILDLAKDMIRLSGLRVGDDIEIEVTGLRPGEKLYEELYNEQEAHRATTHSKIMVADCQPRKLLQVIHDINHLVEIADEPNEAVRDALRQIIPLHPSQPAAANQAIRLAA
jgi:FlaA1/EpsC-like NDP-sugar epimerase